MEFNLENVLIILCRRYYYCDFIYLEHNAVFGASVVFLKC